MKLGELPDLEPLVASLLARAPMMNFMQLCQLLEVHVLNAPPHGDSLWSKEVPLRGAPTGVSLGGEPGFGTRDTVEHEPVRFRPQPRVGFPAGEVAAVEFHGEGALFGHGTPPTVRTTFMGLYGVDAAMPSHMIDDIVLRTKGHEALEAFLDQFNHRFVTLLYRAWKKYRYPIGFRPGGADPHSRRLLSLAGFGWGGETRARRAAGLAGPGVAGAADPAHAHARRARRSRRTGRARG
jgi:type VI secretion system protein ImpH